MEILEYVTYGAGVLLTIIWMLGIRTNTSSGEGVAMSTVNATMLFIVCLAVIPFLNISYFHLLWAFPASVVIGLLSLSFPLSVLSIPGHAVFWFACIGLNQEEIAKNKERVRRGVELVHQEGLTVEEAKKRLEEEGY